MQRKPRRFGPVIPALLGAVIVTLLVMLALDGCASLPSLEGRSITTSRSTSRANATPLGRAVAPLVTLHAGLTGLHLLGDPHAAFAARMLLAREAERTIDAQYYIWQNDITGTMLLAELERAAQRGVRIRRLLDDNGISGLDHTLASLAAEPNFEVRLFNPFTFRHPKWVNYLTEFSRLNHRMHNKSFTVDNVATIIGGRNIGDTYFGATDGVLFADLDVMAIGPVVPDVSREFDSFWSSPFAYPVERIVGKPSAAALERFHAGESQLNENPEAGTYRRVLAENGAARSLLDKTIALTWAPTQMVSDHPDKASGRAGNGDRMIDALESVFADAATSLQLVSPYLVLGANGTRDMAAMTKRGVDVRILTNSLAATDVAAVHAGYAKWRKQLLRAGIQLYELPSTAEQSSDRKLLGPFGSSGSSLHAKTFAVDNQRLFIGSFNFDPRSANLNTEMGFLIESPPLAHAMHLAFEHDVHQLAYHVCLDANGALYWLREQNGHVDRYDTEPGTSWLRRKIVRVLSWLPIDWLL